MWEREAPAELKSDGSPGGSRSQVELTTFEQLLLGP